MDEEAYHCGKNFLNGNIAINLMDKVYFHDKLGSENFFNFLKLLPTAHYLKSQFFVQKFNFVKTPTLSLCKSLGKILLKYFQVTLTTHPGMTNFSGAHFMLHQKLVNKCTLGVCSNLLVLAKQMLIH